MVKSFDRIYKRKDIIMSKKMINIFISYAHKNYSTADKFINTFKEYVKPSKNFDYKFWHDIDLKAGEKWNERIRNQLRNCDIGILLVSAAFLGSRYILDVEIKSLSNDKKIIIPVLLDKINFDHHDLHGLERLQIFMLRDPSFVAPKGYGELGQKRRMQFIDELFVQMEDRLMNSLGKP